MTQQRRDKRRQTRFPSAEHKSCGMTNACTSTAKRRGFSWEGGDVIAAGAGYGLLHTRGKFLCRESSAAAQRSVTQPRWLQGWVPLGTAAAGAGPMAHGL